MTSLRHQASKDRSPTSTGTMADDRWELEGRESLGDYFRMTALLGLLLSVSAVGGIGTLIAGVWEP